ncbi:unnamed protein product [Rhizoctonia solani]|uniref:Uncharacterized protein n=1 Tax=Rhizoctonia solani TaxID=456999 RepID=A0A8H3H270_9AGAM|nr:unnamed protein product [Rhizoctonia solani]
MYLELFALQTTSFVVAARVFDIWDSSRTALFVLGPLWVTHCIIDIVIVTKNAIRQAPYFRHEEVFNICFGDVTDSWTAWLNGIIYHALIILLLAWLWLSTPRSSQTPFMKIIVRGGFVYFFAIFTAMLFNLIIWKNERQSLAALPYWSVWAFTTHALSRMLLSMSSVQTSDEWGQHAKIEIPKVDIELGTLHEPKETTRITLFADEESTHGAMPRAKITTIGKYEDE